MVEQYENEEADTFAEAVGFDAYAFIAESIGEETLSDPRTAAEIIQAHAFLVHGRGKSKGKGKKRCPVRPSYLSVQDRRAKFADLKKINECKSCGRRGHWSGDPGCSVKKGSAPSSGPGTRTAHMSVRRSA